MNSYYLIILLFIRVLLSGIIVIPESNITKDSFEITPVFEDNDSTHLVLKLNGNQFKKERTIAEKIESRITYSEDNLQPNEKYTLTVTDKNTNTVIESKSFYTRPLPVANLYIDDITSTSAELRITDKNNSNTEFLIDIYNEYNGNLKGRQSYYDPKSRTLSDEEHWFKINKKSFVFDKLQPDSRYTIKVKTRNVDKMIGGIEKPKEFTTLSAPAEEFIIQNITNNSSRIIINDENQSYTQYQVKIIDRKNKKTSYVDFHSKMLSDKLSWITIDKENALEKTLYIDDFKSNTKYEIVIKSRNTANKESKEKIKIFSTLTDSIKNLDKVNISENSITLSFNDDNHEDTNYQLTVLDVKNNILKYYVSDSQLSSKSSWFKKSKDNSIAISDLNSNTIYKVSLKAKNIDGAEGNVEEVTLCTLPSSIISLNESKITDEEISIEVIDDNNQFTLYMADINGLDDSHTEIKPNISFRNNQKNIPVFKGLKPNQKYLINVKPVNQTGSSSKTDSIFSITTQTSSLRNLVGFDALFSDYENLKLVVGEDKSSNSSAIVEIIYNDSSLVLESIEKGADTGYDGLLQRPGLYSIKSHNFNTLTSERSDYNKKNIAISDIFLEENLDQYTVPITNIEKQSSKIEKDDILIIEFPSSSEKTRKQLIKIIEKTGQFKLDARVGSKLTFRSTTSSKNSKYTIPVFQWSKESNYKNRPSHILYELRSKDGMDVSSHIYRLNYSSLSFTVTESKRYESVETINNVLSLPPIIMSQKGERNILRKGDEIEVSFQNKEDIKWDISGSGNMDKGFLTFKDYSSEILTFEVNTDIEDKSIWESFTFPVLNFQLLTSNNFPIKLDIKVNSNQSGSEWLHVYTAKDTGNGVKVGKLNLSIIAHTPVYPGDLFPEASIPFIQISAEENAIILNSDTIELNINGTDFDIDRINDAMKFNGASLVSYTESTLSFQVLKSDSPNISIYKIPIIKNDINPSDVTISLNLKGEYDGYTQVISPISNHFHLGSTEELYFEKLKSTYEFKEKEIDIGSFEVGDTLYIRAKGIMSQKNIFNNKLKNFQRLPNKKRDHIIYLYTKKISRGRISIPKIEWNSSRSGNSAPSHILYELRSKDGMDVSSHIYRLNYSSLSFTVTESKRYESVETINNVLSLPPIIMSQKGERNILRKGDEIEVSFQNKEDIKWDISGSGNMDKGFLTFKDYSSEILTFEVNTDIEDKSIWESFTFPVLNFQLLTSNNFPIKLDIKVNSNQSGSEWLHVYTAKDTGNGVKVGKLNLSIIAHTPVYPGDLFPEASIPFIQISAEENAIILNSDTIELNINGTDFDIDRINDAMKFNGASLVSYTESTLSFQVLKSDSPNISIYKIPIIKNDINPSDVTISLNLKGEYDGYTQVISPISNHFHLGSTEELYFEKLKSTYEFKEKEIDIGSFEVGDTLYIRAKGIMSQEKEYKKLLSDFRHVRFNNYDALVFIAKKSYTSNIKIPILKWNQSTSEALIKLPPFILYELRSKKDDNIASHIYRIDVSSLNFKFTSTNRYESLVTENQALLLPPLKLSQNGTRNILRKGDQVEISFQNTEDLEWAEGGLIGSKGFLTFIEIVDNKLIFKVNENIDDKSLWGEYFFPDLFFNLSSSNSFEIKLNARVVSIKKNSDWNYQYSVNFESYKDKLIVGKPDFSVVNDRISGIIIDRYSNRLPDLSIRTEQVPFTKSGDIFTFKINNDEIDYHENAAEFIRLSGTASSKVLLSNVKDNVLELEVLYDFEEGDMLNISNLRIQKIDYKLNEPVKINFYSSATPLSNDIIQPKIVSAFQNIEIRYEKDNYQYAYDQIEDSIKVMLSGYDSKYFTFWDDDFIEIFLDEDSGVKWHSLNSQLSDMARVKTIRIINRITDLMKKKVEINSDIDLGTYKIEESKRPSNFYNIKYNLDNSDKEVSNYKTLDGDNFYSKINFDLVSDYGIYSKAKSLKPFRLPDIIISQVNESSLKTGDQFIIKLDSNSGIQFSESAISEFDGINDVENASLTGKRISSNELQFTVQEIYDNSKPVTISGLYSSLISTRNKKERDGYEIAFIYSTSSNISEKYIFSSDKKIYISSPIITVDNTRLIWPEDYMTISSLSIDDQKSKILGYNNQDLLLRITYDQSVISENLIWSIEMEKYGYEIMDDERVLSIPLNFSDNGQIVYLEKLFLSGLKNFNDVKDDAVVKLEFSFDDGANYYESKDVIDLKRLDSIGFISDCYMDIDIKKQYIPILTLNENISTSTINSTSSISLKLNSSSIEWSNIDVLNNDIEIYSNNKKINKEDIFSINRVKNKLTLNFRRELKPGEKIDIKKLSIIQSDTFESATITIHYEPDNNDIDLIKNTFSIKSTNLVAELLSSNKQNISIYSIRDRESPIRNTDFTGVESSINDKLPRIKFTEIGVNPHLKAGDKIKIFSPYELEQINSNQISDIIKNNRTISSIEYDKTNSKVVTLQIKENFSKNQSFEVPELLLKFNYPSTANLSDSLVFVAIKSYQEAEERNYEAANGQIKLSAGQPVFEFEGNGYTEFIKNDKQKRIPPIKITEDFLLTHIEKGKTIRFILDDDFPATWHEDGVKITTSPYGYYTEGSFDVDDNNSKIAEIQINKTLSKGESVIIDGLMIENYSTVYSANNENPIMKIEMDSYYDNNLSSNRSPYQFGYDFYKDNGWKEGRIGIGEASIRWKTLTSISLSDDDMKEAMLHDFKISYSNIENIDNIPDTFYLQLNTYNDQNGFKERSRSDFQDCKLDVFKFLSVDNQPALEGIIVDEVKEFQDLENMVQQSWMKCHYKNKESKKSMYIHGLKMNSSRFPNDCMQSWYDVSLHYQYPDSDAPKPNLITSSTSTTTGQKSANLVVPYSGDCAEKIGVAGDCFYCKDKEIKLKISHDSGYELIFKSLTDKPMITEATDEGKSVSIGQIDGNIITFPLQEKLSTGIAYKIKNINFDFKQSSGLNQMDWGKGKLSLVFVSPIGEQVYYFDNTYVKHWNNLNRSDRIEGQDDTGSSFQCFLSKQPTAVINEIKNEFIFTFNIQTNDIEEAISWCSIKSMIGNENIGLSDVLMDIYDRTYKNEKNQEQTISPKDRDIVEKVRKEIHKYAGNDNADPIEIILDKRPGYHYMLALTYLLTTDCNDADFKLHWDQYNELGGFDSCFNIEPNEDCLSPSQKWDAIVMAAKDKNWYLVDQKLNKLPKSDLLIELDGEEPTFDFDYDEVTIQTAIGFKDLTGIKGKSNPTDFPDILLRSMAQKLNTYAQTGKNYRRYYGEQIESWKKNRPINFIDWDDEYAPSNQKEIKAAERDKHMKLIYNSIGQHQINSYVYSSNYYKNKNFDNPKNLYSVTLYPRLESNQDWMPMSIYPGAEVLVLQHYDREVEYQRKLLKLATFAVCSSAILKWGIYAAN